MAPRGLSAQDKRVKLLEIFHETKDFYQLKELEKLGPKMKGIVSQSVKEVLQSLVDDGLVQGDKIGSSNFFWSFPSQQGILMENRLHTVREIKIQQEAQLKEVRANLEAERPTRLETAERVSCLEKLAAMRTKHVALQEELEKYGACDPVKIEEKRRAIVLAREAAIRWTENYSILFSYFTRQFPADPSEIKQFLGVSDDYEDIC